jgi:minimal PKS chain-length factor (CLF/KS beta)
MTAVVTGLAPVAPNGLGTEAYWAATLAGQTGIRPLARIDADRYPVRLAGEITGFDPAQHLPGRLIPQTDRVTQLAIAATDWAFQDAGLTPGEDSDFDIGVVSSASAGGLEFGQRELQKLWTEGPSSVSAYMSFSWFYAVNTGQVSIKNKLRGPAAAIVTDGAGGLDAIGHARRLVNEGTPAVVVPCVESALCPFGLVSELPKGRLSTSADPATAYLPFDTASTGSVLGEGGAVLILEDAAAASARGATAYGEIAGYAATFDPPPGSDREPGLRRAAELAIAQAGLTPDEVDVVFADGAGLPDLDDAEADALHKLFGPRAVPVTAPKAMTGRLSSGAGALDAATALLALRAGVIPATAGSAGRGFTDRIDLVTTPRKASLRTALVLARGTGGFNAALLITATER